MFPHRANCRPAASVVQAAGVEAEGAGVCFEDAFVLGADVRRDRPALRFVGHDFG